ncbi:hypothetical protein Tco_1209314 [Tanacetum coccineum]
MLRRKIYDENVPLYYHINKDFSIPFGREEFCLVTGLRFGVQNWAEYDTKQRIPFRRRVFPSYLDGQPITSIDIANMIIDESFAQLYDDDVVGLCCLGILQLVILGVESKRVVPDWMLRLANDRVASSGFIYEDDAKKYSIFGYTWAFKTWILESYRVTASMYFDRYNRYPRVAAWSKKKGRFLGKMVIPFFEGNMPAARLTPDDNEARSDWWISSKAYFDGFIGQVERVPFDLSRQNMYEIPSDIYREFDEQKREIERNKKEVDNIKEEMRRFRQEMNVQPVRQENKEPINVDQHYGLSDFSQFQSMQGGTSSFQRHVNSSYFNMGMPSNFQTPMPSQPGSSVWQRQMLAQSATQYWQPDTSSQPGSYYSFGRVPSHIGRQNLQTTIETHDDVDGIFNQNIPNRGKREQFPSKYKLTPFTEQPPTTNLPKQRVNKTKNNGKKANLSHLNLGGAFEDDNVEENNVTFLGSQFTGAEKELYFHMATLLVGCPERYLKGNPKLGLWYPRVSSFDMGYPTQIVDFVGANLDRKSTTGGKVTSLFASMLVQPTEDDGAPSERPSEAQPTPSPPHTSEAPVEPQTDPSPRPLPSTTIPGSIPESSSGNHGGHSSSDKSLSGNDGEMTSQRCSMFFAISLCCYIGFRSSQGNTTLEGTYQKAQEASQTCSHTPQSMDEECLLAAKIGREEILKETMDAKLHWMIWRTKDAQDVVRTRDVTDKEKVSTDRPIVSADGSKVSTDKQKDSTDDQSDSTDEQNEGTDDQTEGTDDQAKGTDDHTEGGRATQTTQTPTSTIFGYDENNCRAFNYLMEVLHIFDRHDLFHLYDLIRDQYSKVTLDGFELILWGDLKIMMESSTEGNEQSDFWSGQQDWKIVTWSLPKTSKAKLVGLLLKDVDVLLEDKVLILKMDGFKRSRYRGKCLDTSSIELKKNVMHLYSALAEHLEIGEYDIWAMKMKHYLAHTDYPIWEVIQNGNGPVSITTDTQGQIKVLPPRTAEEIVARERERKARATLLMALPEDHLAKFHKMTDAKEMWDAIKSRFGGNDESKKMQKYILKQQFEGFSVSNSEGLHKGYDRTKPGVDSLSFDDLYNNLRVFENDVKGSTGSTSSTQNCEQTSSYSLLANQSSCPQLDHKDLE